MSEEPQHREPVKVTVTAGVATVLLDRGHRQNRLDVEALEALKAAFIRCADDEVEVMVLRGAGEAFCAGRDAEAGLQGRSRREVVELILSVNRHLTEIPAITLAQVHGQALGLGCGLAVMCDITLAGNGAVLGFPEVRHGIAPAIVISYLDRYVSSKIAMELVLTGRDVSAAEARTLGLVSQMVPDADLGAEVDATISHLRALPRAARRATKQLAQRMVDTSPTDRTALAIEALTS